MKRTISLLTSLSLAILTVAASAAERASAPEPKNLTSTFANTGLAIESLQVYEIGGVILIRGRSYNKADAEQAGRLAQSLGYNRVANLVQVVPLPDDQAIERSAERELTIHRSLDGCKFKVDSQQGIIHVGGTVRHLMQKDMAIQLLRNIDGVLEVRAAGLQRD